MGFGGAQTLLPPSPIVVVFSYDPRRLGATEYVGVVISLDRHNLLAYRPPGNQLIGLGDDPRQLQIARLIRKEPRLHVVFDLRLGQGAFTLYQFLG